MTRWWGGGTALLLAALLPAACTEKIVLEHPVGGSGGGGGTVGLGVGGNGGFGNVDAGSADLPNDSRANHCFGGGSYTTLSSVQEVPSIMFALDRSPSMKTALGSGSRFSLAGKAITDAVSAYTQLVAQFGYVEFPGVDSSGSCQQSGCCAGGVVVLSANSGANPIQNQLNMCLPTSNNPTGNCVGTDATPTGQALKKIANNLSGRWLYALVLTDGPPTCTLDSSSGDPACEQTQQQISRMASISSSTTPISTLIVAIGSDSPDDALNPAAGNGCLTKLSAAGGYPTTTAPFYVTATTESQVHSVIDGIVTGAICHVDITEPNYDPTRLEVDFGNSTILPDPTNANGWSLDRNTGRITISGPACSMLIQGMKSSSRHVVVKGCPDTSHPSPFP